MMLVQKSKKMLALFAQTAHGATAAPIARGGMLRMECTALLGWILSESNSSPMTTPGKKEDAERRKIRQKMGVER
ncbi:MAG: hypothetical protein LBB50_05680 [Oscillospiraceae bacterium]|jgi:hypothetical protein|nr:hypothetical protein [Oscillospiraceae bacterium]